MFTKTLILIITALGLSSCFNVKRSNRSGYADYDQSAQINPGSEYFQAQESDNFNEASQELGLNNGVPLNDGQRNAVLMRIRLKQLEAQMQTTDEKRQYYELKPLFKSDAERIYFLNIPGMQGRARWAAQAQLKSREEAYTPFTLDAIESNDIIVGMTRKAVQESWGDPDYVEAAGNELYGNERWNYLKHVSSAEGYKKERRIIYFESGIVAGWERF